MRRGRLADLVWLVALVGVVGTSQERPGTGPVAVASEPTLVLGLEGTTRVTLAPGAPLYVDASIDGEHGDDLDLVLELAGTWSGPGGTVSLAERDGGLACGWTSAGAVGIEPGLPALVRLAASDVDAPTLVAIATDGPVFEGVVLLTAEIQTTRDGARVEARGEVVASECGVEGEDDTGDTGRGDTGGDTGGEDSGGADTSGSDTSGSDTSGEVDSGGTDGAGADTGSDTSDTSDTSDAPEF